MRSGHLYARDEQVSGSGRRGWRRQRGGRERTDGADVVVDAFVGVRDRVGIDGGRRDLGATCLGTSVVVVLAGGEVDVVSSAPVEGERVALGN